MGDLSCNFSRSEFRCRCPRSHPASWPLDLELVAILQRLRDRAARPMPIVSGYRCPAHQRSLSTAANSQHPLGRAADIPQGFATVEAARRAGARGIGYAGRWAVHLDTRPGPLVIFPDVPYRRR